jgi:hypothetical protein
MSGVLISTDAWTDVGKKCSSVTSLCFGGYVRLVSPEKDEMKMVGHEAATGGGPNNNTIALYELLISWHRE